MKSSLFVNWWVFALNGVIALLYGLLAIFAPNDTLQVIITYFGVVVLIIGAALLIGAISNARKGYPYFSDLISALVAVALGAVLAFYTSSAIKVFMYIVGGWAILVGVVQLIMLAREETPSGSKRSLLVNGLVTLAFGVLLFFTPLGTASALVWLSGILAFVIGIMLIVLGMQMKNVSVEYEDAEE